jgi:NhaP-type Na+/H+ or K+/H+ antiporter
LLTEIVEIFITIAGAYITFFISEDIFGVSGVLAIVALGFFMAAFGNSKISPSVQHPLHTVWCVTCHHQVSLPLMYSSVFLSHACNA